MPPFLANSDQGWLTAEYSMLPAATAERRQRDRAGRTDGRSVEIQRLVGRALRAIVTRKAYPGRTAWVDCDVRVPKPPRPSPGRMLTVLLPGHETTRSSRPSSFMSAVVTKRGEPGVA